MNAKTTALTSLVIALLIAVGVADVYATYTVFTSRFPGANDFYRPWAGTRLWLTEGISPYSSEATTQIEIGMYGRPAKPDEDPGLLSYPFYTLFLIIPLAFLPYAWVEAIWLTLLEFALIGSVIGSIRLAGWRMSPGLLAVTLVWSLLFYHNARAILLGQFAVLVFAFVVWVLLALRARHDAWAGVALALSTAKPQMVFLFVPLVLLWAVARRRWQVVIAFGVTMGVWLAVSFIFMPGWASDFVREMLRYPSYTAIGSPVWIITRYFFPVFGAPGEIILSILLCVWMLTTWWPLWRDKSWSAFLWVVGVTHIVTNLIVLRTATTNYVVLLIPLAQVLAMIYARWKRWGLGAVIGLELILLVGLWALFFVTVVHKFEHPIMYLPLPVGLAAALLAWRKQLQQVHPA